MRKRKIRKHSEVEEDGEFFSPPGMEICVGMSQGLASFFFFFHLACLLFERKKSVKRLGSGK